MSDLGGELRDLIGRYTVGGPVLETWIPATQVLELLNRLDTPGSRENTSTVAHAVDDPDRSGLRAKGLPEDAGLEVLIAQHRADAGLAAALNAMRERTPAGLPHPVPGRFAEAPSPVDQP